MLLGLTIGGCLGGGSEPILEVSASPSFTPTPALPRSATAKTTPTHGLPTGPTAAPLPTLASDPISIQLSPALSWARKFGVTVEDELWRIALDDERNVFTTGWTEGTLPGQNNMGGRDAFLFKYDSAGEVLWTRQFGSVAQDSTQDMVVDKSQYVYVVGWTLGDMGSRVDDDRHDADAFLVKFDSSGTRVWTQQFGTDERDEALGFTVGSQGSVYVVGWTFGLFPGQVRQRHHGPFPDSKVIPDKRDGFVRKYDPTGVELWT